MGSERQVHSESVVEPSHEIERDNADHVAHPFEGDRSDLLGLRFGVAVLASGLWDDFDVSVLGAQRLLQPWR